MDFSLCPYKNIFGRPKKGVHQYRILNIAIVDVIGTFIISYIISKVFNYDFKEVLLLIFLLGIILHKLFEVKTTINNIFFN